MDQQQIYELMEKFGNCDLTELNLETEGFKITLKNEPRAVEMVSALPTAPVAAPAPGQAPTAAAPEAAAPAPSTDTEIITSPIVGSFYRSPAPDAPAFVEEGSTVAAGDSICIIEAMKIMNKLEADFPCEIVKILAENGDMVEYGAPLFEVKRA
ncbi:MAG: acetyl-CoA carboxylase biotin carboxyl carrier protein [Spirochaetales bacterium]|nr:acetyl-CoA carboxylase biotin carboxyl carrier protein [Spirochaetales bacterium]